MAASTLFSSVLLVTGGVEFLADRTVRRALDSVREEAADVEVTQVLGSEVGAGELAGLTSPSLFSSACAVVVRGIESLDDPAQQDLRAYAEAPSPDVACVLVHAGGNKGKRLLDALRSLPTVQEVKNAAPKPWELASWVVAEVRQRGGSITEEAAGFLVTAVGQDLRALAAGADQLVDAAVSQDGTRDRITLDVVRRYFGGRAEVKGFDIADAAIEGRVALALEQLRWASGNNVAPVLVTSAFASGLRALARFAEAPRELRDADLARQVGVPPFRLKSLRRQVGGWNPSGLARAIGVVAQADLEVKGAAEPDYALERMVLAVAHSRTR